MMKPKRAKKKTLHVTLSPPLVRALEALGALDGRSTSEILEECGRLALGDRVGTASPAEILAKVREIIANENEIAHPPSSENSPPDVTSPTPL